MNLYAILVFALFGWIPIVFVFIGHVTRMNKRLDIQEAEIRQLWKERRILVDGLCDAGISIKTNALDICRIGDMASDTCADVTAHARVLDDHSLRLSVLEGEQ